VRQHAGRTVSTVQLVDLATGVCTSQPALLHARCHSAAARTPDRRIICAGGIDESDTQLTLEMLGPPMQGMLNVAWHWRALPSMSVARRSCCGCMMSDGRFAVLGGFLGFGSAMSSTCEALTVGATNQWRGLPPVHDSRFGFVCVAVAERVVVAGGHQCTTAEVFEDEVLDWWLRLLCDLPHDHHVPFARSHHRWKLQSVPFVNIRTDEHCSSISIHDTLMTYSYMRVAFFMAISCSHSYSVVPGACAGMPARQRFSIFGRRITDRSLLLFFTPLRPQ
jgi:hypothetical protein